MTDYSVTQYNPYNMYQNYRYSSPAFRGATTATGSVPRYYNTAPQLTQQPDTVSFSAGSQIQNNSDKGLSTTSKALIGIATIGTLIGGYLLHKNMTSPAKKLGKIFRREVSSEEATKLMDRYKEISKIEDKEEYIKQMFNQLKKDYGWEGIDFTYNLNRAANVAGEKDVIGGFRPMDGIFKKLPNGNSVLDQFTPRVMELCLNRSKEDIFATIVHEFQHCKQHELAYRADKNKFIEALIEARLSPQMTEEIAMYKDAINKYYAPVWDKLPALPKGSKEYELGLKYIDNLRHYVDGVQNKQSYFLQLVEREAYSAEGKARDIYKKAVS